MPLMNIALYIFYNYAGGALVFMTILPLIVPLFCMVMIAAYFAIAFKRKLNETYFLSVATIIFILYIFGLLNFQGSLLVGYALILVMALLSLIILIKTYLKDRTVVDNTSYKSGLLLLLIFLGVSLLINYGRVFTTWDEFSHWGTVVKHMYHFDALSTFRGENLSFKSYVPGTALFQYFWARPFPQFTEYSAFLAFNVLISSMALLFVAKPVQSSEQNVVPLKKGSKKKKKEQPVEDKINFKNLLLVVIFLMIPLAMATSVYNTLYVDSFLGIIFGTIFLAYFYFRYEESLFGVLVVAAAFGLLILTKHVGLLLALVAIGVLFIDKLILRRNAIKDFAFSSSKPIERIKKLFLLCSPLIVIVFIQVSWRILLSINDISERWSITGANTLQFLRGDLLPYQQTVIDNFTRALSDLPLFPFGLSYVHIILIIILLVPLLAVWLATHKVNLIRPLVITTMILAGSLAYALFLLLAYSYTFSEYEAVRLASFDRYMLSYLIGMILALLIFIIELPDKAIWKEKGGSAAAKALVGVFLLAVIVSTVFAAAGDHLPVSQTVEEREPFNQVLEWSNFMAEVSDQRIAVIAQGSLGHEVNVLNYMIYPNKFNNIGRDYSVALQPYYPQYDDPWTMIIEPEDWGRHILDNYDYLYLFRIDNLFLQTYGYFFEELIPGMIYEVTVDSEGRLLLLAVGE